MIRDDNDVRFILDLVRFDIVLAHSNNSLRTFGHINLIPRQTVFAFSPGTLSNELTMVNITTHRPNLNDIIIKKAMVVLKIICIECFNSDG